MINCHVWFVVALFVCVAEHEHLINKNERVLLTILGTILSTTGLSVSLLLGQLIWSHIDFDCKLLLLNFDKTSSVSSNILASGTLLLGQLI